MKKINTKENSSKESEHTVYKRKKMQMVKESMHKEFKITTNNIIQTKTMTQIISNYKD